MSDTYEEVDYAIDFQDMRYREMDFAVEVERILGEALSVTHTMIESSFFDGDKVIVTLANGRTYELAIKERSI